MKALFSKNLMARIWGVPEEIEVIDLSGTERLFETLFKLSDIVDKSKSGFDDTTRMMAHCVKEIQRVTKMFPPQESTK